MSKPKQKVLTIISADGKFIAPNRKTARKFEALRKQDEENVAIEPEKKFQFYRLEQKPASNKTKTEFQSFRKELALKHGSKKGKLKKKHLRREINETNVG